MKDTAKKQGRTLKIGLIVLGVFALSLFVQIAAVPSVHAQGQVTSDYTLLLRRCHALGSSCPGSNTSGTTASFSTYVAYAYNLFIALAAVAAVFMIVFGGFEYVTSTIPGNKNDGKKRIENALWGLLLVLGSYLILRTINPQLVQVSSTIVPQITTNDLGGLAKNTSTQAFTDLQSSLNNFIRCKISK